MRYWVYFFCGLAITVMLAACGHRNMVILIPDPDGAVGQITVSNAAGSVKIDQANQATIVENAETAPDAPAQLEPDKIQKLFAEVLSAEPPPPILFCIFNPIRCSCCRNPANCYRKSPAKFSGGYRPGFPSWGIPTRWGTRPITLVFPCGVHWRSNNC